MHSESKLIYSASTYLSFYAFYLFLQVDNAPKECQLRPWLSNFTAYSSVSRKFISIIIIAILEETYSFEPIWFPFIKVKRNGKS